MNFSYIPVPGGRQQLGTLTTSATRAAFQLCPDHIIHNIMCSQFYSWVTEAMGREWSFLPKAWNMSCRKPWPGIEPRLEPYDYSRQIPWQSATATLNANSHWLSQNNETGLITLVIVNTARVDGYPSQQHSNAGNRQKLDQKLQFHHYKLT